MKKWGKRAFVLVLLSRTYLLLERPSFCCSLRPLQSRKLHKNEKQRSCQESESSHSKLITSGSKMPPLTHKSQSKRNQSLGKTRGNYMWICFFNGNNNFPLCIHLFKIGNNNVNTQKFK